jgi:hypothetical protein
MRKKAPGLTLKLERCFEPAVIELLAHHYERVEAAGGNEELNMVREEGVSFNPRIARVASLMLEQLQQQAEAIAAAMWSLVDGDIESLATSDPVVYGIVTEVRQGEATGDLTPRAAVIIAVRELDRVRHLHMTHSSNHDKRDYLESLKARSIFSSADLISEVLRTKLQHAIGMQERCLNDY